MYSYQMIIDECPKCGAQLWWPRAIQLDGHNAQLSDGNVMEDTGTGTYLILDAPHWDVDCRCSTCNTDLGMHLGHERQ